MHPCMRRWYALKAATPRAPVLAIRFLLFQCSRLEQSLQHFEHGTPSSELGHTVLQTPLVTWR